MHSFKNQVFCKILAIALSIIMSSFLSAQSTEITNGGFESVKSGNIPSDWNFLKLLEGQTMLVDNDISHNGKCSIAIQHAEPAKFVATSAPVKLIVGRIYKLSGWIRTQKAFSDPTSRYPTAVAAALTMSSFPFTNHSPAVGNTHNWKKVETIFIATQKEDHVQIHFGLNGTATGKAWFDDVQLEEVTNISEYVPMETVRWYGPAFRYTDKGWTFIHIEGDPYPRGYQYGYLMAKEICALIEKIAVRYNPENPKASWMERRTLADALFLREFDQEYLEEMKGIADGAVAAGASFGGKSLDFLDVVTVNSFVDLGQLTDALQKTANPMSGRTFRQEEEEAQTLERLHKCSSFLANGPATKDNKIVFAQLFMWNGYTGVHWDVICDLVPTKGNRIVYETFPGGIHSGADFYINSKGIMIGETTVYQTPFDIDGTPQSSRIRKAIQYGNSIDDIVKILTEKNNGLYTNDWLIADTKNNEIAILLLGTKKFKLWRSKNNDFPGGTTNFYWSVNNAKDMDVRKEYVPDPTNAPFDVVYGTVNRDSSFFNYYQREKGFIDATSAVNLIASSPINRPHACDGKVATSEMAEQMVFMAHYGKVTLREKFPEKNNRLMPDLVNAIPHLTLGYSVFSPIYIVERLKEAHAKELAERSPKKPETDLATVAQVYSYDKRKMWYNTVYPATEGDNWFVSATAAYWNILNTMPSEKNAASGYLRDQLAEMNYRYLYVNDREEKLAPLKAQRTYNRFGTYSIPRIKGTYALHQLRLKLGNEVFAKMMDVVHTKFKERPMSSSEFAAAVKETSGKDLRSFIYQWLERDDIPDPAISARSEKQQDHWIVKLDVDQKGAPYTFLTTVAIETASDIRYEIVEVIKDQTSYTFPAQTKPTRIVFNVGNDIPVPRNDFYTLSNYFDDYQNSQIIYGTGRHIEANHTLALRFQTVLADQFTEILPPVVQDAEVSVSNLQSKDFIVIGQGTDNSLLAELAKSVGLALGKNMFRWRGKNYCDTDDGMIVVYPNPYNPKRTVYLVVANSALQLYWMTKRYQPLPAWGIFKGETVMEKGYHPAEKMSVEF